MIPAVRLADEAAVDPETIGRFTQVLFDGLSGFVDVRLLTEKGTPQQPPQCHSLAIDDRLATALARYAANAADLGRACFVVPATTQGRGRARATNVTATAVIIVDLDDGDIEAKRAHLVEHIGTPALVVASGGVTETGQPKLHLYWRLSRPATGFELVRACRLRETLARKSGGDPSLAKASQPIRLAGSVHCKHGDRAPVRIIEESDRVSELEVLERAAEAMPKIEAQEDEAEEPEKSGGGCRAGPIRAGGLDGITRFDALSRFIGDQVRRMRLGQVSRADAWRAVTTYNATMIAPSWDETRLRREFDALEIVDRRNHGGGQDVADHELDRTEHGLARRLVDDHAAEWRHVAGQAGSPGRARHWRSDDTGRILELCRRLCEEAARGQAEVRSPAAAQRPDHPGGRAPRPLRSPRRGRRERMGHRPVAAQHAGGRGRSPHRRGACQRSAPAADADHPRLARQRLSALAGLHRPRSPAATPRWPATCSASPATA